MALLKPSEPDKYCVLNRGRVCSTPKFMSTDKIDEEWERRGYSSKSEAIRDALRDWLNPSVTLSEETLAALQTSREQRERGETRSLDEVAAKYDVDLDE